MAVDTPDTSRSFRRNADVAIENGEGTSGYWKCLQDVLAFLIFFFILGGLFLGLVLCNDTSWQSQVLRALARHMGLTAPWHSDCYNGLPLLPNATLQTSTALPLLCRQILAEGVVSFSEAQSCLGWCHAALGGTWPYLMSPQDVLALGEPQYYQMYMACWKAQVLAWAKRWIPRWYDVYAWAGLYGLSGMVSFVWTWCHSSSREPHFPDHKESKTAGLRMALLALLLQPVLDVASLLNLLRLGQVFPTLIMVVGIAVPSLLAGDPLQITVARAAAESWRQGCQMSLVHKRKEFWEAFLCTMVQIYMLNATHPSAMDPATALQFFLSVAMSCAISLPSGAKAMVAVHQAVPWEMTCLPVFLCLILGWLMASALRHSTANREVFFGWSQLQPPNGWLCTLLLAFRLGCCGASLLCFAYFAFRDCYFADKGELTPTKLASEADVQPLLQAEDRYACSSTSKSMGN